jgi:putative ABC transport system substrate-binding protein
MITRINRRKMIALLGGAAAAWRLPANAQQPALPEIGYLHGGSPGEDAERVAIVLKTLSEMGFVEGRNVVIEHRWAENQYDRLPALAGDLVRRRVAVIFIVPPVPAVLARAKALPTTIPVVFIAGTDPVRTGVVASFNRPGGNATGVMNISSELGAKRLGLLHELVPAVTTIAVLNIQSFDSGSQPQLAAIEAAAGRLRKKTSYFERGHRKRSRSGLCGCHRAEGRGGDDHQSWVLRLPARAARRAGDTARDPNHGYFVGFSRRRRSHQLRY